MTRGELKERLAFEAAGEETRYDLGDWAKMNAFLDERTARFTQETDCLYVWQVALTLVANTAEYECTGTSAASPVHRVKDVFVEKQALLSWDGRFGRSSASREVEMIPGYPNQSTGKPNRWFHLPGSRIRLSPTPDAVYACTLDGFGDQPAIGVGASWAESLTGDAVELSTPPDLDDLLVRYCLSGLLRTGSKTWTDLEPVLRADVRAVREASQTRVASPTIVGWRSGGLVRTLC